MNKRLLQLSTLILAFTLFSCTKASQQKDKCCESKNDSTKTEIKSATPNTAAQIMAKQQVPVLCYHRISETATGDYAITPATFSAHVKVLKDSGYHSISPDQLYDYLVYNKSLPEKPFMITFDDSRVEHREIAGPVLEKAGFRGVFFIMTITYNKKNYMTTDQIAEMAKAGHTIGLHSWDHTMATKYLTDEDWKKQVEEPKKKLEGIIGQPVNYWAYPNGVSNHTAAVGLSKYFKMSFILSTKRDSIQPLQTVRRIIVPDCKTESLLRSMRNSFSKK